MYLCLDWFIYMSRLAFFFVLHNNMHSTRHRYMHVIIMKGKKKKASRDTDICISTCLPHPHPCHVDLLSNPPHPQVCPAPYHVHPPINPHPPVPPVRYPVGLPKGYTNSLSLTHTHTHLNTSWGCPRNTPYLCAGRTRSLYGALYFSL